MAFGDITAKGFRQVCEQKQPVRSTGSAEISRYGALLIGTWYLYQLLSEALVT